MDNIKVIFSDIETFKGYSLFTFLKGDKWYEFSINEHENHLNEFIEFLRDNQEYYFAFYNGLKFDCQVITHIYKNQSYLSELSNLEIADKIWWWAQLEIENTRHEVFNSFREDHFPLKCLDLMEIPHFTNKNRRTSLKWLAFMMDMESIEELPYKHDKVNFTKEECEAVRLYCRKDIVDTERWYQYLRGNVQNETYKGKDKIQDRIDLINEGLLPQSAITWNDVKIGDELNLKSYCNLTGKTRQEVFDSKKRRGATKKFTFGDAIPKYVKFKNPKFITFYNSLKDVRVSLLDKDKQEFKFTYKGTTYSIMRGGIHSTEKNRVIIPKSDEILRDADIGSQYPNAILKRELYVSHLGKPWLVNYTNTIAKRLEYKSLGKNNPKYKGLSEMFKLCLNGGGYGKTGEKNSWQYDPKVMYYCTIGNQFEILMLIEMLEDSGIHCVSANTDGILCLFKKDKEEIYNKICKEWEVIVGNSEMGMLEYQDFTKIWQESINHYVAIKPDGSLKIKGRFLADGEMHKNNTDKIGRIERKAIVQYVKDGTPIEETIRNCTNIYDFCMGLKSSKKYHFQTIFDNKVKEHKKIIRFFISNNGERLIKVLNEGEDEGIDITRISNGFLVTMFNDYYKPEKFEDYDINYDYYIQSAKEIIAKVEKNKTILDHKDQLTLF